MGPWPKKEIRKKEIGNQCRSKEIGVIRGVELIFPLHDAFHIAELELIGPVKLFDDLAVFVPILRSARSEDTRLGSGRR